MKHQLSGGQEQRVAIARAIATDPDMILADELTGNLDAASAQKALAVLSRLNREHDKTIVMVTHDAHAARHASIVRHLEKGVLLREGELPDECHSIPQWSSHPHERTGLHNDGRR
jgi:putative ABC transport system ATP-binding protein